MIATAKKEYDRTRYAENPDRYRETRRASGRRWWAKFKAQAPAEVLRAKYRKADLRRYGLTVAEFDLLLSAQGGKCAACAASTPGEHGVFCVDHDHISGKVRGLLCGPCNRALGHAKEDPARLRNLARYIESYLPLDLTKVP